MVNMNVFRILGDISHTASKCILIWAIHTNQSAEGLSTLALPFQSLHGSPTGVSLITQMLYAAVFCTRYLDIFWTPPAAMIWNFILKIFYIFSSLYIIIVMLKVFPRTREREKAWKFGLIVFAGSLVGAPFVSLIFTRGKTNFPEVGTANAFELHNSNEVYRSFGFSRSSSNLSVSFHNYYSFVKPPYQPSLTPSTLSRSAPIEHSTF